MQQYGVESHQDYTGTEQLRETFKYLVKELKGHQVCFF